jgi:hypothetical protein
MTVTLLWDMRFLGRWLWRVRDTGVSEESFASICRVQKYDEEVRGYQIKLLVFWASILKVEALRCSETSVNFQQTIWCLFPSCFFCFLWIVLNKTDRQNSVGFHTVRRKTALTFTLIYLQEMKSTNATLRENFKVRGSFHIRTNPNRNQCFSNVWFDVLRQWLWTVRRLV